MTTSLRGNARQNLMVAAINVALDLKLISLDCEPFESATFEFELIGLPVIAHVRDAGFDEVSIKAIVGPTELGRKFAHYVITRGFQRFGAATTFGWLERRDGKYLQTDVNYHGSKTIIPMLADLIIAPNGFGTGPTKDGYDFHKECNRVFGRSGRSRS